MSQLAAPPVATPLMLELLEWVASRPRTYADAIDAWRSNCPRHSVWDDAFVHGLIQVGGGRAVTLTALGEAALHRKS